MRKFVVWAIFFFFGFSFYSCAQDRSVIVGAERTDQYLLKMKGKKVGLIVNHTSLVQEKHLVDFLLENEIEIVQIFSPEHGFRGNADAGEEIDSGKDVRTGIGIFSLYGKNRKPTPESLSDLDLLVFDIQDVGCRFYTYISTLHYVMEAAAENGKPLLLLDRPNPNGDYVDGPVLEDGFKSFVGMHPIPIVHGCTVGELARMINGENWLNEGRRCDLEIIPLLNWDHNQHYSLPGKPSPNLPNDRSIRLYPSLCFFEATDVSVGRGTKFPFQVIGAPRNNLGEFTFTPQSIPGMAKNPLHENQVCYGIDLREMQFSQIPKFTLSYFLDFYHKYENKSEFLIRERWFNLLAGTGQLLADIRAGKNEPEIRASWKPALEKYKLMRKKYLLYPDFK